LQISQNPILQTFELLVNAFNFFALSVASVNAIKIETKLSSSFEKWFNQSILQSMYTNLVVSIYATFFAPLYVLLTICNLHFKIEFTSRFKYAYFRFFLNLDPFCFSSDNIYLRSVYLDFSSTFLIYVCFYICKHV